jgi:hypothetical protein
MLQFRGKSTLKMEGGYSFETHFHTVLHSVGGTRWSSLRHCAASRKAMGSVPDGVNNNPSGRIMALGSNQHLREMSTRNISWGIKAAGAQA